MRFSVILRVTYVLFCLTTYFLAYFFGVQNITHFAPRMMFVFGLVFYIVAAAATQVECFRVGRPAAEILLFAAYPVLAYFVVFAKIDPGSKFFWTFIGFYNFFIVTGSFLFGIFLAPLIARLQSAGGKQVKEAVKVGLAHIKNIGLSSTAILLFGGVITALAYFSLEFLTTTRGVTGLQKFEIATFLFIALTVSVIYSFRHTVFNIDYKV